MTTVFACRREAQSALECADSETAELDAQTLLAHALGVDRAFLFAHADERLTEAQLAAFRSALERRAAGEPIAYITGSKGFYDLDLLVSPAALIPRPETELLLEEALRLTEERPAISSRRYRDRQRRPGGDLRAPASSRHRLRHRDLPGGPGDRAGKRGTQRRYCRPHFWATWPLP